MYKSTRTTVARAPVGVSANVTQLLGHQGVWLKGREFLGDVHCHGGAYVQESRVLRPTDYSVFSWLGPIATKFNNYKFRSLAIVYEPSCPSSTAGSVGVYFDPDPSNTGPANWSAFTNTGVNAHGAPWSRLYLPVSSRNLNDRRELYTKSEYPNLNAAAQPIIDPLEHFAGIYGVVVDGGDPNVNVFGKWYLEYSISLWKPVSDSPPVTSLSGNNLNPVVASNSGTGMFVSNVASFSGTEFNVIGHRVGVSNMLYYWSGFGYFERHAATGLLTVLQDVELLCCIEASCNGGGTVTGPKFYVNSVSINNTPSCHEVWLLGSGAANMAAVFNLRLRKGENFAVSCNHNNSGNVTVVKLMLAPYVFGLDQ